MQCLFPKGKYFTVIHLKRVIVISNIRDWIIPQALQPKLLMKQELHKQQSYCHANQCPSCLELIGLFSVFFLDIIKLKGLLRRVMGNQYALITQLFIF
jgi:hypothetical protein